MKKSLSLSFEVFPPKKDQLDLNPLFHTIDTLIQYEPDFISVTYGAAGSTNKNSLAVVSYVQEKGINALAHLTCADESETSLREFCSSLINIGVKRVLALRGDAYNNNESHSFKYASDLMEFITSNFDLEVAGTFYPETHKESQTRNNDVEAYLIKQKSGSKFLISQLFFENSNFYSMKNEAINKGLKIPIYAGIMPITSQAQFDRITKITGVEVPLQLKEKFDLCTTHEEMFNIGIDFAVNQIIDLIKNDVEGIHLYIMNQSVVAKSLMDRLENYL